MSQQANTKYSNTGQLFDSEELAEPSVPAQPVNAEDLDDFDDWILDYFDDEDVEEEEVGQGEKNEEPADDSLFDAEESFTDLGLGEDEFEQDADFSKTKEEPVSQVVVTYVAHYISPVTETPVKGYFEFDSIYRASSKLNRHDARIKMLEIFGQDAVSWVIDEVKKKKKTPDICSDQFELDFREPKKPRKRRKSKKYW